MDEIDWIKHTKKALITLTKVFIGVGLFFAISILVNFREDDLEHIRGMVIVSLLIGVGIPIFLGICYLIIHMISKILNSGRTVINFDKGYVRDLPKHCSPAICSLIYDLKTDIYKDYTATILYLCIKKYLELIKEGEIYKLKSGKQKDISNLGRCEKYVLDIIKKEKKFDADIFKEEIITEAQEKELIMSKKHSNVLRIMICTLFAIISLIIMYNINKIIFLILIYFFSVILYVVVYIFSMKDEYRIVDTNYVRTKDGKNIALLLKGLKRYMKEYTLIKDKEIDYIQILENYIPYALALGEADAVEEFIKYNEEYRDLIYNRKSM